MTCESIKRLPHSDQFLYIPPAQSEPVMQNVTLGYKISTEHRERVGKHWIKIRGLGKTRRYYISKFAMSQGRILNDKWVLNLIETPY